MARELCSRKGWVDRRGKARAVSAQILLSRMATKGLIELPARRAIVPRSKSNKKPVGASLPLKVYDGSAAGVEDLGKIEIVPFTRRDRVENGQWNALMASHHYLGAGPLCGARIRYLVRCEKGLLGGLAFSAPAWRLASRDRWIEWSEKARSHNLEQVVCNSRFLLVPRVRNLASHVLAEALRRLPEDWEQAHGYRPLLVETFVDSSRFAGTCYVAAGWTKVGVTTGRGRQDRKPKAKSERTPKKVFVHALDPLAREKLCIEPVESRAPIGASFEETEFGDVRFRRKDKRLKNRLMKLARAFLARPTANIPQACGNESQTRAAYRFFAHQDVTMKAILNAHYEASLRRASEEKVVLAVQDTTSFNYTSHKATEGLGPIGNKSATSTRGLHLHSTMLINLAGTPLGLIDTKFWARDPKKYGKSKKRYRLTIKKKESRKWLGGFDATERAQSRLPKTSFVSVGDREADIYELFLEAKDAKNGTQLLIRALHKERCIIVDEERKSHLHEHLLSLPCSGTRDIYVPKRKEQPARDATIEIRFTKVKLKPPVDKKKLFKTPIEMWAILANEPNAPEGCDPVEWMLLTTLPVETYAECQEKLAWYALRWQIEIYHRTIKSGCRIEHRQLGTADSLGKCIAIDLVVGYQVYNLAKLAREMPDAPCTIAFEEWKWKALVAFTSNSSEEPKTPPPNIRDAVRLVAKLGGFLGRKSDGEPGTTTIWRGLERLDDIARTFAICWRRSDDTS